MIDNDVHVIPEALSSLTNLYYLNVSKNVLTDIPDTIKQCKQLTILDASVNPLQKIPEGCGELSLRHKKYTTSVQIAYNFITPLIIY